ncbi:MAG: hypothetical protein LBQ93_08035 [Treponema sp.]|jgi:CheY-like chemotaxis protein|nr:hypothetical protein [Treponema sp.]
MDINLYAAEGMLLPYGLQIDTALSGFDAIGKIKYNIYNIVFMGHMMPRMDDFNNDTGIELTKKLLPYDFGGDVNILLKNALAALENFKFDNTAKSLTKIVLSVE